MAADPATTQGLDPHALTRDGLLTTTVTWTERDAVCYALAAGFGRDELERSELPYLFEGHGLVVMPTFAALLVDDDWLDDCGWQRNHVRLTARELEVFSPMLPRDSVEISSEVSHVWPDPAGEGCHVRFRSEARRARDRRALFALTTSYHARADRLAQAVTPALPPAPKDNRSERDPDFSLAIRPEFDSAVLYRWLAGGPAWHIDTDAARRAGYDRPVVPGDCLIGAVCRAVLATVCDFDPTLLRGLRVRLHRAVYADADLRVRMWQDGPVVSFDVAEAPRGEAVLSGRCTLAT
ncbi:MAG: MaoC/PaaZ C-terminal domain-containing protein [Pseudomonadota bacterium]